MGKASTAKYQPLLSIDKTSQGRKRRWKKPSVYVKRCRKQSEKESEQNSVPYFSRDASFSAKRGVAKRKRYSNLRSSYI